MIHLIRCHWVDEYSRQTSWPLIGLTVVTFAGLVTPVGRAGAAFGSKSQFEYCLSLAGSGEDQVQDLS